MKREDFKEFDKFQYLLIPYNFKTTKKFESELEKTAVDWFKSIGAQFGKTYHHTEQPEFRWYYGGGILFFGVNGLSDSEYAYQHVVAGLHFQYWDKKAFNDGWSFGRGVHEKRIQQKGNGKDNPYSKNDVLDYYAWNVGFTWGLYNVRAF